MVKGCYDKSGFMAVFSIPDQLFYSTYIGKNRDFVSISGVFLLGNSLNGMTLGIDKISSEVHDLRDEIVTLMGLGTPMAMIKKLKLKKPLSMICQR